MSKTARAHQSAKKAATASPKPDPSIRGNIYDIALRPQRKLLVVLLLVLAVWVGYLLTLYFRTVYPLRHSDTTTRIDQ